MVHIEDWVRKNINKQFDPIDMGDVYKAWEYQQKIIDNLIEKYNSAIQSIDDYDCYDRNTGKIMFKHEIFKSDLDFLDQIKEAAE